MTALTTAAGEPTVADSPTPFAPSSRVFLPRSGISASHTPFFCPVIEPQTREPSDSRQGSRKLTAIFSLPTKRRLSPDSKRAGT